MSNLISKVPLIPPVADALEAEARKREEARTKIQSIVDTYKGLGWYHVNPVETENRNLPIIALWPNRWGVFTAHLNLTGVQEVRISHISLFHKDYLGSLQFKGHHLTPNDVQAIVQILTGYFVVIETEIEAIEENTGALAPVAEK